MRARVPATGPLPVAFAVSTGAIVGLFQPILWPTAPGGGIALGLLAALFGWVGIGQVPERLETAVTRKADVAFGVAIAAPATAVVVAAATGQFGLTRATVVRAIVAVGVGIVPIVAGTAHRGQQRARTEQAHATAEATFVTRWYGLPLAVGAIPVFLVITAALGQLDIGGAAGAAIVMAVAAQFSGEQTRSLTVIDSGVVFDEEQPLGATYVPWDRLSVSIRDDTVRLRRQYFVHSEYRVSCADAAAAQALGQTFEQTRQQQYLH